MRHFGLRPRLLAALVLTSAVSLGFAAIALLSPLKNSLRQDSTTTVLATVGAAMPGFEEIDPDPATPGQLNPASLRTQVRSLELRSGGRVAVFDSQLKPVENSDLDPDLPLSVSDVALSLKTHRRLNLIDHGDLVVTQPVEILHQPYVVELRKHLEYVQEATRVVGSVFLKAAAVGLAVALLLGIGLSATLVRRLERLRDATRNLDRGGIDAVLKPDDSPHDEIGELTRAFIGLQERLRHQESARRAFVATASHELRTPLASLDGMLELLADDLAGDPIDVDDARRRLTHAQEQSRRLGNLAADLLDLSRIDADVELRSEPIECFELARAVAAEFDRRASERDVSLSIEPATMSCWAEGDPGSVARIVRILLDNALRAAPSESTVSVAIDGARQWTQIEVRDRGPGVLPAERDLIFERFQRGSGRGGEGGFGLGLAIGRELATRMGGSLELVDDAQDGTVFRLRLKTALVAVAV
ncbi:MAG TPA: HAMP domain-containing sensor histidine kinase [Solirubrobacteraceae bacterium]